MIKIAEIQFHPWDKIYDFYTTDDVGVIKIGERVLVMTKLGPEIGKIVGLREENEDKYELLEDGEFENRNVKLNVIDEEGREELKPRLRPILRKVDEDDLNKISEYEEVKPEALEYCKNVIKRMELPMKLIDAHFSFDGGRITFAFIADGRIDFRDLVKELTRHFQRSICMQQLGARDEVKVTGDIGSCGRSLCCRKFLKNLGGISSEFAANQQVAHRGAERLSGACGRLMCCLRYENDNYVELAKNMPEIGSEIDTYLGLGKVIGWHTLKQTVDVKIGEGDKSVTIEIDIKK